jgi:protein-S-isoprenylcysteine O-methyltransferase Ste14
MLAVRTLVFTILYPGTVTALVPWLLLRGSPLPRLGLLGAGGVLLAAVGAAIYGWCAWGFAVRGRGTPAPYDPPSALVVKGLYQFVRNPMYVGIVCIVLGEAVVWRSLIMVGYAALLSLGFHLRVVYAEEPALRRLFGEEFEDYCATVPRWLPRFSASQVGDGLER